jgi:hypothetical protein
MHTIMFNGTPVPPSATIPEVFWVHIKAHSRTTVLDLSPGRDHGIHHRQPQAGEARLMVLFDQ